MKEKVLALLKLEARLTNKQIAAALGASEEQVSKTISELEASGIIKGYRCIVDKSAISPPEVTAIIELKVLPKAGRGFEYVAEIISGYPQVEACALLSGASDLMVTVRGGSIQEISEFVYKELALIDGVTSCSTQFIMKQYKELGVAFFGDDDDGRGRVSL